MKYNKSPAWKIPQSTLISKKPDSPGPGAYSYKEMLPCSPSFSIGKSKRPEIALSPLLVGPGTYTPSTNVSSKSAIFGSSPKRSFKTASKTPGPGQYELKNPEKGPSFSIKGKDKYLIRNSRKVHFSEI